MSTSPSPPIPILLLKSSSPTPTTDPYTTHLTTPSPQIYTPHYIPVLTHTLLPDPLISLLLTHLQSPPFPYGALLLTSQRAVLALHTALRAPPIQNRLQALQSLKFTFYVVGPATERAVREVRDRWLPGCRVVGGEEAGSGEVLGRIMIGEGEEAYREREGGRLKPVLFLTGEKRRDVLPKMLMDPGLEEGRRVKVDEMVVYETKELEEFEFGFGRVLRETEGGVRWVVVFSPTAGRGMLRALGWLDEEGGRVRGLGERRTFVVAIGPTTREYLEREFGFEADVVAERPSPQGAREGIERFMRERGII